MFFFSSRRRHTRSKRDWSSDVCSSDLPVGGERFGSALAQVNAAAESFTAHWVETLARNSSRVLPGKVSAKEIGRASCRERVSKCEDAERENKKGNKNEIYKTLQVKEE